MGGVMRILVHRLTAGIEICPRLGLVLMPQPEFAGRQGGRMVRYVFAGSPAERAGIQAYDMIGAVGNRPWDKIQYEVLSDRRASELVLDVWMPRFFARAKVIVRVYPEPFAPIADIVATATRHLAEHSPRPEVRFVNPRYARPGATDVATGRTGGAGRKSARS
jgi:hypothetical protein